MACGLLVVCLLLAMVCFWFACVLRFAVRFFVAILVFLGVPLCSLVFPAFPFFARFPFPCQDRFQNHDFSTLFLVFFRGGSLIAFVEFFVFFDSFLTPVWEVFGSLFLCFFDEILDFSMKYNDFS